MASNETAENERELANVKLYDRAGAYIPRVAAVHDLCGYGKCSLGVAIPVLSAAGCDVCPVPTGLFSSHTAFPGWYMHDTTAMLRDYLDAWRGIGVDIDAVYSGFLGAPEQVDVILNLYETYPDALRVVDPVMADHGKIYPTYTPELCDAMAHLACSADILTPNLTEAAIILGEPIGESWGGVNIDDAEAHRMVNALLERGAKHVVLKGVQRGDGVIRNFVGGRELPIVEVHNDYVDYMLHGTGDVYASCLLAAVMAGQGIADAAQFAGEFVLASMEVSAQQPDFRDRGVNFESLLGRVTKLLR
ncbi:PfkB family carbohydrate kinase [Xiamenia xianingshaonis]|uniref:pyridoxal kinase n=1 Tax=Xiamenia xianingshaonis TaxID=2682776 RepID=A0A9E6MQL9_9ACTN|nr:PfkB family carbohydrate kinase [Xiamenia xianingshaonis]NHM13446.1 pyridoxine kinase [Xiamenia xianingshaonis]QTU84476.1 bifunctional hydroxymethylpyrimidine kinase/phosphomethylpyrimidine kinase [Xiamenia xianingshaonis]